MRQQPSTSNRLKRAQEAARNNQRGQRGRFRARRRFFGMRRRPYSRRSIFIAGLPRNINSYRLNGLLRREARVIRCTLLRDRFGRSRGIAFAELQNPRDAWNIIKNWRGRNVGGNTIFVTYKRNPNRFRNNYSRYNRYGNRQFRGYGGYNSNYQRQPNRPRGNRGRGRGF
jgi:RNA recognition motif-containing protein